MKPGKVGVRTTTRSGHRGFWNEFGCPTSFCEFLKEAWEGGFRCRQGQTQLELYIGVRSVIYSLF